MILPGRLFYADLSQRQRRLDERFDVLFSGAVIDNGGANRNLSMNNCARWRANPGFLQLRDKLYIDLICVGAAVAEANDVQRHRRKQFELGRLFDKILEPSREITSMRDDLAEFFRTVDFQREPRFQRSKAAGEIRTEIARPR